MTSSTIRRALLASAAVLASAGAAYAQTQTAASTGGIETVVVTAQYKSQNIQSTPLAITAVTAEDLEKHGYSNLVAAQCDRTESDAEPDAGSLRQRSASLHSWRGRLRHGV